MRVLLVHRFYVLDGSIPIGTVIVNAQEVRRVGSDAFHEVGNPSLSLIIAGAGGTDELLALLLAQGQHLLDPDVGGVFRGYTSALGLVEEVDDWLVAILDVGPVLP